MAPWAIGRDLRQKGFVPEFIDDEPRTYLTFGTDDGRIYVELSDG